MSDTETNPIGTIERLRRCEEALKWYADRQNYLDSLPEVEYGIRVGPPVTSIQVDCGARARAALADRKD
jgi:hypothetical protein